MPDIEKARREIREANGGQPPKVLDCFAGGGNIALEALRLGCETYALDLNPVAVLIEKAALEFPQKYSDPEVVKKLRPAKPHPTLPLPGGGQGRGSRLQPCPGHCPQSQSHLFSLRSGDGR